MDKYSDVLDNILTLPPSLLEILKEGNFDSHYECSECKYLHESLPHNSRCKMCGGKILWICQVCSTSVEAKGKSAHSRTSKHKINSQNSPIPKSVIQEVTPSVAPSNTFVTLKGVAFTEDSQIIWNDIVLQTYFCKKEGTLHCFSPVSTLPSATICVMTDNQPSNYMMYQYVPI